MRSRAASTKADGLWRRYRVGLILIMVLILSAHYANRAAVSVESVDTDRLRDVGELQVLSQQILIFGTNMRFQGTDAETLEKLDTAIEALQQAQRIG